MEDRADIAPGHPYLRKAETSFPLTEVSLDLPYGLVLRLFDSVYLPLASSSELLTLRTRTY